MPTKPTRSNLMRRGRTADVPPICKSKDDATGIVSVCDCPECENCEQIEFYDGQFDDMMQFIDDQTDQCGAWSWDGDEDDPADSGEFNNCIPKGEGEGDAHLFLCFNGEYAHLTNGSTTYIAFVSQCQTTGPPEHSYIGSWTSSDTGETFPISGDNCPSPP